MEKKDLYYFAYGSNMNTEQMNHRCPGAVLAEKCCLTGYRFAIDDAKFATIIPDDRSFVEGVLWKVGEQELVRLDRYEGVAHGCYRREIVTVDTCHDAAVDAVVYISNRPERKITDGTGTSYMLGVFESACAFDFDTGYRRLLELYAHA